MSLVQTGIVFFLAHFVAVFPVTLCVYSLARRPLAQSIDGACSIYQRPRRGLTGTRTSPFSLKSFANIWISGMDLQPDPCRHSAHLCGAGLPTLATSGTVYAYQVPLLELTSGNWVEIERCASHLQELCVVFPAYSRRREDERSTKSSIRGCTEKLRLAEKLRHLELVEYPSLPDWLTMMTTAAGGELESFSIRHE